MLAPELTVQVSPRRWNCVLDPVLVMSRHGVPLACGLGRVMDVWIVPEFWHILDNTCFYLDRPELLLPPSEAGRNPSYPANARETISVLRQWEALRDETDVIRHSFHWLGDAPRESSSHAADDAGPALRSRWEHLARALDRRSAAQAVDASEPLRAASRDAVALSVSLPAASILTFCPPQSPRTGDPPAICKILSDFALPCRRLSPSTGIGALERDTYRYFVVHAGLAKYAWAGVHLAVLQIVAPHAAAATSLHGRGISDAVDEPMQDTSLLAALGAASDECDHDDADDPWEDAEGIWYAL